MWPRRGLEIEIKTPEQFAVMREAGLVVARALEVAAAAVRPGVSTAELDALAERGDPGRGRHSLVQGLPRIPATCARRSTTRSCTASRARTGGCAEGDIVSIDCGAIVRGWHGDAALTVGVGAISAEHAALLAACEAALWQGIAQAQPGRRLGDIWHAVETSVASSGRYGVVEEYTGHGIGTAMHMDPPVPNYGRPGRGPRLRPAWPWPSSRWSCSATRRRSCSTTAGRSSPPTGAGPRTSSTRWPSRPPGRGC